MHVFEHLRVIYGYSYLGVQFEKSHSTYLCAWFLTWIKPVT